MQKWEYQTVAVGVADLAALGQQGWRLVAIFDRLMFFERPVVEEEAPPAVKRGKK